MTSLEQGEKLFTFRNSMVPLDCQLTINYWREFGAFVLEYIQKEHPDENLDMGMIGWCITVPSNWRDIMKLRMNTCLVNAGLVRSPDELVGNLNSPISVLEPEAAARYCHKGMEHFNLRAGDKLMVVDIGSGSLDFIVQRWVGGDELSYKVMNESFDSTVLELRDFWRLTF